MSSTLVRMSGTNSKDSYIIVARRGHIGLGIKFVTMGSFSSPGLIDKTYIGFRVRSAYISHILPQEGNVVSLAEKNMGLDEAWPNFAFEKVGEDRASLMIGTFIRGNLNEQPEKVLERLNEGDLIGKAVDYVFECAGAANLIADRDAVVAAFNEQLQPAVAGLIKAVNKQKKHQEAAQQFAAKIESELETFGQQAAQLQSIYKKLGIKTTLVGAFEEDPEGDDPDDDGTEDGYEDA